MFSTKKILPVIIAVFFVTNFYQIASAQLITENNHSYGVSSGKKKGGAVAWAQRKNLPPRAVMSQPHGGGGTVLFADSDLTSNLVTRNGDSFISSDQIGRWGSTAVGDIDKDGNDEIVVSSYGEIGASNWQARIYVYSGTNLNPYFTTGLANNAAYLGSSNDGSGFGSLAIVDMNGDGTKDVLIGRPGAGKITVLDGSSTNAAVLMELASTEGFGTSFSAVPNAAGSVDLAVGTNYGYWNAPVKIYSCPCTADSLPVTTFASSSYNTAIGPWGRPIAFGENKIADTSAHILAIGASVQGYGYLYFIDAQTGLEVATHFETGNLYDSITQIDTLDFNNDGYSDFIIGTANRMEGTVEAGKAYVAFGPQYVVTPLTTLVSNFTSNVKSHTGNSVDAFKDVDGSVYLMVGATHYSGGTPANGLPGGTINPGNKTDRGAVHSFRYRNPQDELVVINGDIVSGKVDLSSNAVASGGMISSNSTSTEATVTGKPIYPANEPVSLATTVVFGPTPSTNNYTALKIISGNIQTASTGTLYTSEMLKVKLTKSTASAVDIVVSKSGQTHFTGTDSLADNMSRYRVAFDSATGTVTVYNNFGNVIPLTAATTPPTNSLVSTARLRFALSFRNSAVSDIAMYDSAEDNNMPKTPQGLAIKVNAGKMAVGYLAAGVTNSFSLTYAQLPPLDLSSLGAWFASASFVDNALDPQEAILKSSNVASPCLNIGDDSITMKRNTSVARCYLDPFSNCE